MISNLALYLFGIWHFIYLALYLFGFIWHFIYLAPLYLFGTLFSRFPSDGAASMAVKGLTLSTRPQLVIHFTPLCQRDLSY